MKQKNTVYRAPKTVSWLLRFLDTKIAKDSKLLFTITFKLLEKIVIFKSYFFKRKSVLFAGQCYYNCFYLSRALRNRGWKADLLNWDSNENSQIYYHGEDFLFLYDEKYSIYDHLFFYLKSLFIYEIFHFSNAHGISFSSILNVWFKNKQYANFEIFFLKKCGKKIVYSNNACLDGVSKTAFSKWKPFSVCSICKWNEVPEVCSDERNLSWGQYRNTVADFQINLGGNRADFNLDSSVHEVPEFYCLNPDIWDPSLPIPNELQLKDRDEKILLYHGIGNKRLRTSEEGINIHCSHIYFPIVDKIKKDIPNIEIISPSDVPNKKLLFIQSQCDIFLDMLTYGWYGAMAREAMMLGKPVICFIRPEWAESVKAEIPEFIEQLPIVSATQHDVEEKIRDLAKNEKMRKEIGIKSRKFAIKWHGMESGGKRFDEIYSKLMVRKNKEINNGKSLQ